MENHMDTTTLAVLIFFGYFFLLVISVAMMLEALFRVPHFLTEQIYKDAFIFVCHESYDKDEPKEYDYFEILLVNGRKTQAAMLQSFQAIQVNPKCMDQAKFNRACWAFYGTGRTEPDAV
jgi:hypothetical protein